MNFHQPIMESHEGNASGYYSAATHFEGVTKDDKKDDDNDDDDNDDHTDRTLVKDQVTGSSETRKEKMQTPNRSLRTDLFLDKTVSQELTATLSPTPNTTSQDHSKPTSSKTKVLSGSIARMSRRQLTVAKTNELIKEAVPRLVNAAIMRDREITPVSVPKLISQEFVTHAPRIIEELFKSHMQNIVFNMYPTIISSTATTTTTDLQHQLYLKMKSNLQDQADDSGLLRHDDHYQDNAPPESTTEESEIIQKSISPTTGLLKLSESLLNNNTDMYYLCLNKKVNYHENKLLNSLMTFIKSCVIWERVHDFQLGIESYQIKINLTAPTLIFSGIEARDPYSIVDKPTTGLIYLNNKEEKRVMYLVEIVKFCDATLERVLNEVKLKIFETEFLKKAPLLGGLDLDTMKAYEREITNRLRHREQIRRWESFVNGRPILPTMRRQ
ncbi:hypothetical protein Tco_0089882 [Tanacetum coccineum]